MIKKRIVIRIILAVFLVLAGLALLQASGKPNPTSQGNAQAQEIHQLSGQYRVQKGTAAGGDYALSGLDRKADNTSSGGKYILLGPASPSGGTPCCCVHLPCIRR